MAQIDPTNPAIRAAVGLLRERHIDYTMTGGGKSHKLEFELHGKIRRVGIGCGSSSMDGKIRAVTREIAKIFEQADAEHAAATAARKQAERAAAAKPKKPSTALPANYRDIRYGDEGSEIGFWLADDAPTIGEMLDRDGVVVVCTGLGKPFRPTSTAASREKTIDPEWVAGQRDCVAYATRRLTPEEQAIVDEWLDEATNPTMTEAA